MKKKKILIIVMFLICNLFICSCWDYRDINNRDITLASMIERNPAEKEFILLHEVADLTNNSSGVDIKYLKTHIVRGYGSTFEDARNYLEQASSNPTFLGTAKVVIFGKEMAEYGVDGYFNRIKGVTDYRKTIIPCVSMVDYRRLTDKSIRTENSLGFIIEKLLKYQRLKGTAAVPTAGDIFRIKNDKDIGYLLPCITVNEDDIKYYGHGVFRDNRLIGILNKSQSLGISYLINDHFFINKSITLDDAGKKFYSFIITKKNRKIHTDFIEDRAVINIDLIIDAKFKFQYFDKPILKEDVSLLEETLSRLVKDEVDKLINLSQIQYKCDFFNFKKYFKVDNYDIYKKHPWGSLYENAKVNIRVKTKITDFNLLDTEKKEFNEGRVGDKN